MLRSVKQEWLKPELLLALACWREARGETPQVQLAMCCSVRNRVTHPGWWGHDWKSVILAPWQYSSFNPSDPNSTKYPETNDPIFQQCLKAAQYAMTLKLADVSFGADSYFDKSLDSDPPKWTKQPSAKETLVVGRLRFWQTVLRPATVPSTPALQVEKDAVELTDLQEQVQALEAEHPAEVVSEAAPHP